MKSTFRMAGVFIAIMACTPLMAQRRSLDSSKMERDLRIMEGVLDKVLSRQQGVKLLGSSNAQGIYVPDYGMIFYVRKSAFSMTVFDRGRFEYIDGLETLQSRMEEMESTAKPPEKQKAKAQTRAMAHDRSAQLLKNMTQAQEEAMAAQQEAIKAGLVQFYRDYTPAISQLKGQDRIAVLVQFGGFRTTQESSVMTSWMSVEEIAAFRKSTQKDEAFVHQIHFPEENEQARQVQSDIEILLEIFNRATGESSRGLGSSQGFYLDGFGALISLEMSGVIMISEGKTTPVIVGKRDLERAIAYTQQSADVTVVEEQKKRKARLKEQIDLYLELLADYGHTLRLPPEEWVVITIQASSPFVTWTSADDDGDATVIQLKKKDLDAYHQGSIDMASLRKRIIQK